MEPDVSQFALVDKVALVTGGGQGIGSAIALTMARAGADIAVTSRNMANLEKTAEQIREMGRRSLAIQCDVAEKQQVRKVVRQVLDELGRIDILVNNAGIGMGKPTPAQAVTDELWDRIMRVNSDGATTFCRYVGEIMVRQNGGAIVNIASYAGPRGLPLRAPYCQSKAALIGLTKVLAGEWARYGVRVNAVAPGWIISPMNEALRSDPARQDFIRREIMEGTPLGRWGEASEVANAVLFLVSSAASYITGDVLFVDGGKSSS